MATEPNTGFQYPSDPLSPEMESEVSHRVAEIVWDVRNEVVTSLLGEILSQKNPALTAAAMAYASGMTIFGGSSQVEISKKFGVTKQAFSRRVVEVTERLQLRLFPGMRSEASREIFREKQLCRKKSSRQQAMQSLK